MDILYLGVTAIQIKISVDALKKRLETTEEMVSDLENKLFIHSEEQKTKPLKNQQSISNL